MLPDAFVQENFEFNGKYLNGQKELEPRWKRCVSATDRALGEALGQLYVAKNFPPDSKQRTLDMVKAIEDAMDSDLKTLEWMTPETKKKAEEKLDALRNHIGYPDKWRDYSSVAVKPNDALGNSIRAEYFEEHRQLNKIGKPVDKEEWGMTPPTVNAYYRPPMNDINFPAGILQPPFFDKNIDDAVNFGAMGVVVGHELTHGFDDQGAKFAADGNFTNWWSPKDEEEFKARTGCLADEYSKFSPVEGVNLNGRLTLGENTADNGGARLAFMAMEKRLQGKPEQKIDGFTPEQRFFLGFAQIWCENVAPERSRVLALTDPHSPGQFRVKGVVINNADFEKAYGCKPGQPMVSENACHVW
jgi:predicted metalloendopeptidase